jgi:predicted kinase
VKLALPERALVLLVGPSGSGKSTFARNHFRATEIVSSDAIREALADDAADQGASAEAFQVLSILVNGRLRRRLMTVIDATNLRAPNRKRLQRLAGRCGIPTVAIAFDLSPARYRERNQLRAERVVDESVVDDQSMRMAQALGQLPHEGYFALHLLREADLDGNIELARAERSG